MKNLIFTIILAAYSQLLYGQYDFLKIRSKNVYASYLYFSRISKSSSIDSFKIELSTLDSGKIVILDFYNIKLSKNKIFVINKLNQLVLDENFREVSNDSLSLVEKIFITFYSNPKELSLRDFKKINKYKHGTFRFTFKNENYFGYTRIYNGLILTLETKYPQPRIYFSATKLILDSRSKLKRTIKHFSKGGSRLDFKT